MGLFKSQKSVNEGLFEATYEQYRQKSFDLPLSGDDLCVYHYWLYCSKSLANNLLDADKSLMKAWGKGSPAQAAAMCEVCVQPIISMWYGNIDVQSSGLIGAKKEMPRVGGDVSPAVNDVAEYPQYYVFDDPQVHNYFDNTFDCIEDLKKTVEEHSSEFPNVPVLSERERGEAIKLAISNMLHLFGTYTDIRVQHFLNLDLQYVYDEKIREQKRISLYYIDLVLSKLAEALGYQNYIDWDKQTFPVKVNRDFRYTNPNNECLDFGYDIKSRMSMIGLFYISGVVTFKNFKFMNQLDALGHSEEAPNNYNRLLEKTSNNSAALDNHGNTFGGAENHDEELIRYDRSLKLHPDDLDTLNNRGDTLYELGRYEEALNDYNRSLELQPDDSEVLASRGDVLYELERFEEALRDYNRSIEISSDDTLTLEGRGDTLSALGRYEEALNDYNRLLELEPNNPDVLKNREAVIRKLKQHKPIGDTKSQESIYDKAAKDLKAAINKSQTSPSDKAIMNIQTAIFTSALSCNQSIRDAWSDIFSQLPSDQSDFGIRTEIAFFFIRMMCMYAFAIGGPQFRANLQDKIVESSIRELIRNSFHEPSGERPSFATGSWGARFVSEVLDRYNESELDYGYCEVVGGRDDFLDEKTILGKLAERINRDYAGEKCPPLRRHICAITAESLGKSGIKEQLEEIHRRELI